MVREEFMRAYTSPEYGLVSTGGLPSCPCPNGIGWWEIYR